MSQSDAVTADDAAMKRARDERVQRTASAHANNAQCVECGYATSDCTCLKYTNGEPVAGTPASAVDHVAVDSQPTPSTAQFGSQAPLPPQPTREEQAKLRDAFSEGWVARGYGLARQDVLTRSRALFPDPRKRVPREVTSLETQWVYRTILVPATMVRMTSPDGTRDATRTLAEVALFPLVDAPIVGDLVARPFDEVDDDESEGTTP